VNSTRTTRRVDERDVLVRGVRLHLREVGDPNAPPVLFLHGIMGHRRDWDAFIDIVGGQYRVLALDQRGHGRSAWTRSYRITEMTDDVVALVEQLGIGPLPVVGHSMGAMVGLVAAARHPDLVERLAVIDIVPGSVATDFAHQLPAMFEAMAAASYATVDEAVAEWQAGNPLARPDLLRNYVRHALVPSSDGRLRWGFDAKGLRTFLSAVTPGELWAAIDAVGCPALVVRGELSPITTPEETATVAERLGQAPVVVIPSGGHDLGVEQPEPVADAVLEFLCGGYRAMRAPT
jgi:pimeloyl-ACP methyl ester carboxylesterase